MLYSQLLQFIVASPGSWIRASPVWFNNWSVLVMPPSQANSSRSPFYTAPIPIIQIRLEVFHISDDGRRTGTWILPLNAWSWRGVRKECAADGQIRGRFQTERLKMPSTFVMRWSTQEVKQGKRRGRGSKEKSVTPSLYPCRSAWPLELASSLKPSRMLTLYILPKYCALFSSLEKC